MPALLTIRNLAVGTPDGRTLVSGLSLIIGRERCGLVGRNGSGKSSLLRVLAGAGAPKRGSVERHGTVGVLHQVEPSGARTAADALGLAETIARLDRLGQGQGTVADAAAADWTLEARLGEALERVGLSGLRPDCPLAALSGGERTRLSLARLILEAPDVLLLDEPTNNLDMKGRDLVTELVRDRPGGIVFASHDRSWRCSTRRG